MRPAAAPGVSAPGGGISAPLASKRKVTFSERRQQNKCCLKKAVLSRPGKLEAALQPGGWLHGCGVPQRRLEPPPSAERVFEVLRPLVHCVSKAARRGSIVAGLVLMEELRLGDGRLQDSALGGGKDNSFMGQCFTAGSFIQRPPYQQDVCDPRVDDLAKRFEGLLICFGYSRLPGDRQAIQAAANEHWTNFKNHCEVNLEARLMAYIKAAVARYCPRRRAPRSDIQKALRYVTRPRASDPVPHMSDAFAGEPWDRLVELRAKTLEACATQDHDGTEDPKLLRHRRFLRLVELTYWILQRVEEMDGRPFCMFPLCGHKMRHVAVDSRVFADCVYPRLTARGFYDPARGKDPLSSEAMWTLLPGAWDLRPGEKWTPGACFKTDGYSLCVSLKNLGAAKEDKKEVLQSMTERGVPPGAARVGIDMGLKTIFHAAWKDAAGRWKEKTLTRQEYYQQAGHQAHVAKCWRRERRLRHAREALSECRRRSSSMEDLRRYLLTAGQHEEECWRERGDFRLARSRMAVYMKRVSCLDRWVNSLTEEVAADNPEAPSVAVRCGFPKFNSNTRGCKAAPTTLAFKRLALSAYVVPVDEYLTSKVCYHCNERLEPPRMLCKRLGRVVEERSVRLCRSIVCRERLDFPAYEWLPQQWPSAVRYSRDKNAAKHIHDLGGLCNEERPDALRR